MMPLVRKRPSNSYAVEAVRLGGDGETFSVPAGVLAGVHRRHGFRDHALPRWVGKLAPPGDRLPGLNPTRDATRHGRAAKRRPCRWGRAGSRVYERENGGEVPPQPQNMDPRLLFA